MEKFLFANQRELDAAVGSIFWADQQDIIFIYSVSSPIVTSSSKFETVYVTAGIHSTDVVICTEEGVTVEDDELFIEIIDLEGDQSTNLSLLKDTF
ncbi:unnamed protein product [Rotaria sp. Silwood2]|nr:unnamed protein product [Rotaria sp. Silwood2]CAF4493803.1 unnamed protein product [Rotaria sp. Silwood2]